MKELASCIPRCLMLSSCLLITLCGTSSGATLRPVATRPVYVVFHSQVVAVDADRLRVVKRLDFVHRRDLMWMAHRASIRPSDHVLLVEGERENRDRTGWGLLSLSLPDLAPIRSAGTVEPSRHLSISPRTGGHVRAVGNGLVVQSGKDGRRFDYLASRASRPVATTTLELPSAGNEYECVFAWTVSPDQRKLLVLTSGGFKEQAYLRVHTLPSLALLQNVPLLEILDDSPVALLLDAP